MGDGAYVPDQVHGQTGGLQGPKGRFPAGARSLDKDIHAAHAALTARGVAFEQKPHLVAKMPDHDLWMAFFRDPDENLLAVMCEVRE